MNDLSFPTKPKWVRGAKSASVDFLPSITKVDSALAVPGSSISLGFNTTAIGPSALLKFGSHFPEEYFLGKKKSEFIAALATTDCAHDCYLNFCELCESLPLTSLDRSLCLSVLGSLYSINSNWFLMPTSSTGKYHGGMLSAQNTVGGIYQHSLALCNLANSVLARYKEVIESLATPPGFDFPSQLLTACILHDIGKMNLSQSTIYSVANHGEVAADFIASLGFNDSTALLYAISNHMYGWKAINVFNHIVAHGACSELVLLFVLCECDFFGSV